MKCLGKYLKFLSYTRVFADEEDYFLGTEESYCFELLKFE